jgi:riboflavin biosynthesis pyrimidine reductase
MPNRPHANPGAPFETLFETSAPDGPVRGGDLPVEFRRYGDRLAVGLRPDRPTLLVNFVETLDGVVTLDPEHGSGAEVSGYSEPDRFVMGLLRALADAIVVGAGTLRAASKHVWTPSYLNRSLGDAYASWRLEMGLAPEPTTIVVTAQGDVPMDHPALNAPDVPVVVITTARGADQLRGLPPGVKLIVTGDRPRVTGASILDAAGALGARVVLSEGGPHLTGTFLAEHLLDEFFLTLAPQLVGRSDRDNGRFGLIEGVTFGTDDAPWALLRSVRRSVDHLFLRYSFGAAAEDADPTPAG